MRVREERMDARCEQFRILAEYNQGANARLFTACARLSDEERKRDRGSFFGSIHATLNHILVGDRVWLARFRGAEVSSSGLDRILYTNFAELRRARVREDAKIKRFVEEIDAEVLSRSVEYVNNEGRRFNDPVDMLLLHFFNHQTHHRGQVHAMLTQAGEASVVLDLHRILVPDPP